VINQGNSTEGWGVGTNNGKRAKQQNIHTRSMCSFILKTFFVWTSLDAPHNPQLTNKMNLNTHLRSIIILFKSKICCHAGFLSSRQGFERHLTAFDTNSSIGNRSDRSVGRTLLALFRCSWCYPQSLCSWPYLPSKSRAPGWWCHQRSCYPTGCWNHCKESIFSRFLLRGGLLYKTFGFSATPKIKLKWWVTGKSY